jgi:hypothetical protein
MKKIIYILTFLITSISFSQKRTDPVVYENFNYELFNQLLLEEVNIIRKNINVKPYGKCDISKKASDYQVNYMSYYSTPCHYNDKKFRGILLETPESRVNYFNDKKKTNLFYSEEVCLQNKSDIGYPKDYPNTYEGFAKYIINGFMSSKPHKMALLSDFPTIPIKNRTASFSTSIIITKTEIDTYVAGVVVDEY